MYIFINWFTENIIGLDHNEGNSNKRDKNRRYREIAKEPPQRRGKMKLLTYPRMVDDINQHLNKLLSITEQRAMERHLLNPFHRKKNL